MHAAQLLSMNGSLHRRYSRVGLFAFLGLLLLLMVACATPPETESPESPSESADIQPEPHTELAVDQPVPEPELRYASTDDIRFQHLSLEQGLSQSVVNDILQDDQGFLWFGTQDGLNRYDGYDFTIFRHNAEDPAAISSGFIAALAQDQEGIIWIGTNGGGLNSYNSETGEFKHYMNDPQDPASLSGNQVSDVIVDEENVVWIATINAGLNKLDRESGGFVHYTADPQNPHSINSNTVTSIAADPDGSLWLGTIDGGLNKFDPTSEEFTIYENNADDPASISGNSVNTVHVDRDGILWAAFDGYGLDRFNAETGQFTHFRHNPDDPQTLSENPVTNIYEDSQGNLWLGTGGSGLSMLDRQSGKLIHHAADSKNPASLNNDQILSIIEDEAGVLWFGTFGGGLNKFDPARQKFGLFRADPEKPNGLNSDHVWTFLEDSEGILWIGTFTAGLNRYDPNTGEWTHYLADPQDSTSLPGDSIVTIYEDNEGQLWVASTDNGIGRLDRQTGEFTKYSTPPWVLDMVEDSSGQFWIGGFGGLGKYDAESDMFNYFENDAEDPTSLSDDGVVAVVEDHQGQLWIGTFNGGLNKYDPQNEEFIRFQHDPDDPNSLGNDMVLSAMLAENGDIWLGTSGGLDQFDPQTETFTHYGAEDGLLNETVYAVLEDDQGKIWVSTNMGISEFDPQTETFRHFDTGDGLQSVEFNQGAAYKSPSGEMFFGGVSGFNVFHPELIRESVYEPPVVVTDFQLFNESVVPGEESPLAKPIEATQDIELAYTDDFLTFEFSALDYSAPEDIQYAYMMEGLDQDWNYVGTRRFAGYTNVPPGDYTFHVKSTNSDGIWGANDAAINVVIPPPYWQTWWFRILAVLSIAAIALAVFAARLRSVEAQRERLEVQVDERTKELTDTFVELEKSRDAAESANRAKSTFLANMSHEFRTPLNAILGFTQLMLRDTSLDDHQSENVEVVHRSSEHLLGLINDVLEISKIEAGRTVLNSSTFDLHRMLYGLEEMFRLRAEYKGVSLRLELTPSVPQYVRMDEGKLRQVLMNLLGNSVKFTEVGHVLLRVTTADPGRVDPVAEEILSFLVEDSGPGISPDEADTLFEPFVQATAGRLSQEGTGLGLTISQQHVHLMGGDITVQSDEGQGSVFRFEVPCEVVPESAVRKPIPERHIVGLEPGQQTYRLLIVDDEAANRQILDRMLAPLGFEVREAANGQEAIAAWKEWAPHLIWMDMRMPVMDGHAATRCIKEAASDRDTIIIALTASGLEEEREEILAEGCDDYLRKPFYEEDLYNALAEHLGVRFIYDDDESLAEPGEDGREEVQEVSTLRPLRDVEIVSRISGIPPDLVQSLVEATTLGDVSRIENTINEMKTQDPRLATELATMAHEFEHERILTLIQQANGDVHGEYQ